MLKKEHIVILMLVVLILVFCMAIIISIGYNGNENLNAGKNITQRELIANSTEDPGSVEVIRNIGNPNGEKIAYVVGVHPLEHQVHETLVKMLPNMTDLNYCYDIYIINVTENVGYYGDGSSDDSPGRQNGQNLAYKYVYPEIVNGSYNLAIDVHSNIGAYPYRTFVFSPLKESLAGEYANEVASKSANISYYSPESTTSGPFLTVPLNENGVPAFYFEEYSFYPQDVMDAHVMELIKAVDSLKFK